MVAVRPVLVASEAAAKRLVNADAHWDYLQNLAVRLTHDTS